MTSPHCIALPELQGARVKSHTFCLCGAKEKKTPLDSVSSLLAAVMLSVEPRKSPVASVQCGSQQNKTVLSSSGVES